MTDKNGSGGSNEPNTPDHPYWGRVGGPIGADGLNGPPKWRVSKEKIWWYIEDGNATRAEELLAKDLWEARAYITTLGIENDELRERVYVLENAERIAAHHCELTTLWSGKYDALRDAVLALDTNVQREWFASDLTALRKLAKSGDALKSSGGECFCGANEHYGHSELCDKSGGADLSATSNASNAAQILVRNGKPYIFSGAWIGCLTKDRGDPPRPDPLWPVWEAWKATIPTPWPQTTSCDGLYTVIECEACGGTGFADNDADGKQVRCQYNCHDGQTLKRESGE